jgi:stage V sporulation protein B
MSGIPNALSKYLSEGFDGKNIKNKSFILQSTYTILIAIIVFILSPVISNLLNDFDLIGYIRFLSIIIFIRSLNQLYGSIFNGYRDFQNQSILMVINSVSRIIFVFAFVYLGYSIYGVLGGYLSSSFLGLLYGMFFSKTKRTEKQVNYKNLINFSFPIILFSFLFHLITTLDLFFIKASSIPENYVGYYTSARLLSTFYIIIAVSFSLTLFPSISSSFSSGNKENTDSYIKTSLRYILLLFVSAAVIISAYSKELLSLFFTSQYAIAKSALSILIWGWLFLQLFFVLSSIINSSGKSKIPAFITGIALIVAFLSNHYLVNQYGIEGGAMATLITGVFCLLVGIFYVHRIFRVSIEISSLLRIISASLIILLISLSIKIEGILLIFWCIILFSIYLGILLLIREINKEDIRLAKDLLKSLSFKN